MSLGTWVGRQRCDKRGVWGTDGKGPAREAGVKAGHEGRGAEGDDESARGRGVSSAGPAGAEGQVRERPAEFWKWRPVDK